MAHQLKAAVYTLVRNWRAWVALGLVVLNKVVSVEFVTRGVTYGLQDSLFRDKGLVAIVLFAGAAVAVFEQRGGALRSSCLAEKGRARHVISRFAVVAGLTLALLAVAAVLDMVAGALVPGASVIAASPAMCAPDRVVAGVLTYLVIAEVAYAAALVTKSQSALATAGMVAVAYVALVLLVILFASGGDASHDLTTAQLVGFLLPLGGFNADVTFAMGASLIPLGPAHAFAVPLVWLAALLALERLHMARRTV